MVDSLVLGTAQLVDNYGITASRASVKSISEALNFLDSAWDLGFNCLDTAPVYGDAEEVIGRCGLPFYVHTKLEPDTPVRQSLEASLNRLQRNEVDLLYIHRPNFLLEAEQKSLDEIGQLRNRGTKRLGISVYEISDLSGLKRGDFFSVVQFPYNIADRRFGSRTRSRLISEGRTCVIRSVFLQGLLVCTDRDLIEKRGLVDLTEQIRGISERSGLSPMEISLAWVAHSDGVSNVIVAAQDVSELRQIASAWKVAVASQEIIKQIEEIVVSSEIEIDPRKWI